MLLRYTKLYHIEFSPKWFPVFFVLQGKSIGWLLGQAVADAAKVLGASKIYLKSNTSLKPAINLYHKQGFKKVVGRSTPYERCNIQMELEL